MSTAEVPQERESREELVLRAMIFAVGVLGIGIGLLAGRATELSLGFLCVFFAAKMHFGERCRREPPYDR